MVDHEAWEADVDGPEVARVMHSPLAKGFVSGSRDGGLVAPLMGEASKTLGTSLFAELGFLSAFLAYPDYGVIYRFIPREVLSTEMELIWLVKADALEGGDYTLAELCWLWDVTSLGDKAIIERNQKGVRSRFYRPGAFSPMEPGAAAYVARYVRELGRVAASR
jgi:Rieske 2Fe-2S family protein